VLPSGVVEFPPEGDFENDELLDVVLLWGPWVGNNFGPELLDEFGVLSLE